MSRYIGPSRKILRKVGWGNKDHLIVRNKKKKSKHLSIYGLRLQEKRKLKQIIYGLRDRQLKNDYIRLRSGKLGKEANILTSLESRIDSLVFRSGLVNSLPFARQLVVHKHFLVLSKKNDETMKSEIVKSPSYRIKPGQTVVLRKKKMTENKHIKKILEKNHKAPNYLTFDKNNLSFSCLRYPSAEELESKIKVNTLLIAEWYDRRIKKKI